jgi:hypothetical protein
MPTSDLPFRGFPRAQVAGVAFVMTILACSSGSVPIGKDGQDSGAGRDTGTASDSGGATCGTTTCAAGELCCESEDSTCTPTCMSVAHCPVLGRACQVGDAGADAKRVDAASSLEWYWTCGDPVCQTFDAGGVDAGSGIPGCQAVGASCSTQGATCGTPSVTTCGATLICDDKDPKGPGGVGCPISSRAYKDGIQYVGATELQDLHDEALRMKLATYTYQARVADPHPKHLGFIVEDNPDSAAVDPAHHRVDLYGYVSMVVAAMQVQEKEIVELRAELAAAQHKKALPSKRP